jgi:flagellar motor switch/type III secretory pathway protein FliN
MPGISEMAPFLGVPLPVEAVIDGPRPKICDLLALREGSIIATRLPAGESVEIRAGGSEIGAGELTVLDGRLAVRMLNFDGR